MTPTYDELFEKLSRLQWLFHRQRKHAHMKNSALGDSSRGQGRVLAILSLQPELSSSDLLYLLGIRQQSVNEQLSKLEAAGLIERHPSESDRRVMMVRLTEQGREEQQKLRVQQNQLCEIFHCLEDEEQENLADYLDRLAAELEEQLPEEEEVPSDWAAAARERMGDEKFERLMAMRQSHGHGPFGGHRGQFVGRGLHHIFGEPGKTPNQGRKK